MNNFISCMSVKISQYQQSHNLYQFLNFYDFLCTLLQILKFLLVRQLGKVSKITCYFIFGVFVQIYSNATSANDLPTLSISSPSVSGGLTEGLDLDFTIQSDQIVDRELDVSIVIVEYNGITRRNRFDLNVEPSSGIVIDSGTDSVVGKAVLNGQSVNPNEDKWFIIQIYPYPPKYNISPTNNEIIVRMKDNFPSPTRPRISLRSVGDSVEEGGLITFSVEADTGLGYLPPVTNPLPVHVKLSNEEGDFIASGELLSRTVMLTNANSQELIRINTKPLNSSESDGIVRAQVVEDSNYILTPDLDQVEVTVTNRTQPIYWFEEASVTADESDTNVTFTINRSNTTANSTTVDFEISGTMVAGEDYIAPASNTLTFTSSEVTKQLTIQLIDDRIDELAESISVTLTESSSDSIFYTPYIATATITDNDVAIVSVPNTSVYEGNAGQSNAMITISLDPVSTREVSVYWHSFTLRDDTALFSQDFYEEDGTVTFAPLQSTIQISQPIIGDTVAEGDEHFTVLLFNATSGAEVQNSLANVTIIDDEGLTLSFQDSAPEIEEDVGNYELGVNLSGPSGYVEFTYEIIGDTATAGTDFLEPVSLTGTIENSSSGIISIPIADDTEEEDNETFTVRITSVRYANFAGNRSNIEAVVTILKNDLPILSFANQNTFVEENVQGSFAYVEVRLDKPANNVVYVRWYNFVSSTDNATYDVDFRGAIGGVIEIPIGQTSGVLRVAIYDDQNNEGNETFRVGVSLVTNAKFISDEGITGITSLVTILDTADRPTLNFDNYAPTIDEDAGTLNLDVSLTNQGSSPASVTWSVSNGTAIGGEDFVTQVSQEFMGLTNETSGRISIPIISNSTYEGDETFTITLSNPLHAYFPNRSDTLVAEVTISDDTDLPVMSIPSTSIRIVENPVNQRLEIPVTLTGTTELESSAHYTTTEGTARDAIDFIYFSKSILFPVDEVQALIKVPIIENFQADGDKNFSITISNPENLKFANGANQIVVDVTIVDDESLPVIEISPPTDETLENGDPVTFTLTATQMTTPTTLSVRYTPAEVASDFLASTVQGQYIDSEVDFAPDADGNFSGEISVTLEDDQVNEATGKIQVTINADPAFPASTYIVGSSNNAQATILDDDAPELIISSGVPVTEGPNQVANFNITARSSPNRLIRVKFNVSQRSSGNGNFITNTGDRYIDLDFRGNLSTVIVPIDLTNDDVAEDDGFIRLALEADELDPINYSVPSVAESSAEVKVFDDENSATLSIVGPTSAIPESDGSVTFDIYADSNPRRALVVRYSPTEVNSGNFLDATASPSQEAINSQLLDFEPTGTRGQYIAELVVPIHDDNVGERSGAIQVTLLADEISNTYEVTTNGSETAIVSILDNEAPELSISSLGQYTEGTDHSANFQISAAIRPMSPLTVFYTPVSANFLSDSISGSKQQTITPLEFSTTAPFTAILNVEIDETIVTEATGQIAVTLEEESTAATTYTVASSPQNTATVPVTIVEFLPLLTIKGPTAAINESDGEVDFTITTTSQITESLTVRYTPSEVAGGNFLDVEADPSQEATNSQVLPFINENNIYTATLTIPIHDDNVREHSGKIQVTLLDDNQQTLTYRIANDGTQIAYATIMDDEVPELSIVGNNPVTEGPNKFLNYTVNASFSPNQSLRIYNGILQSGQGDGSFISSNFVGYFDLDFSNGATTAQLSIPVIDDDVEESSSVIGVVLAVDEADPINYTVVTGDNSSAEIAVYDDESLPVLSLLGPTRSILESEAMVTFSVISDREPDGALTVRYQPAEVASGNFLDETVEPNQEILMSRTLNFTPHGTSGQYASPLNIPIHDDEVHEITGMIQVTLLTDNSTPTNYFVASDGSESVMVTILDDDAPVLSISGGNAVTEGPNRFARFTISAVVRPESPIAIKYLPQSANFLSSDLAGIPQVTANQLEFSGAGPYTATLIVPIHDDNIVETNGSIRVTLQEEDTPGTNYTVASSPNNTAVVNVIDDDSLPLLTISAPSNPTPENNGQVNFTISTAANVGSPVTLRYLPAEVAFGNFLDESVIPSQESTTSQTINFSSSSINGLYSAVLPVSIHDDDVGERTGSIQVTLLSDNAMIETYRVASTGSETAIATIADEDTPELSITGVGPVTEGPNRFAQFTVSSNSLPDSPLTINFTPESTNFLATNVSGTPQSTINPLQFSGNGPYTSTLRVLLDNDSLVEANGRVTVTLNELNQSNSTYLVASSPNNTAFVEVIDDDALPLLRISGPSNPVVESAEQVIFSIETIMFPISEVSVRYVAAEVASGNYLDSQTVPSQEAETAQVLNFAGAGDSYFAYLTVPIQNDVVGESTGQINVTLLADNNAIESYRIASDGTQIANATIWDDDAPEMIITGSSAVTEDYSQTVEFTISSNVRPKTNIQFDYQPESTIYLASGVSGTRLQTLERLNFSGNGPYTTTLSVNIIPNDSKDGNNRIAVTLLEQLGINKTYTVAPSPLNSAFVEIIDDESIPVLSSRLDRYEFPESEGYVEIKLIATNNPTEPIPIRYSTAEYLNNDFLDENASPSQEGPATQLVNFVNSGRDKVGTLRVPIHNDQVGERNGSVKVTIFSDSSRQVAYKLFRYFQLNIYLGVLDDDAPELSISGGGNVTEGVNETANFSISTKVRPKNPLVVDYIPTSDNFLAVGESGVKVSSAPLHFTGNGPYSARLQINIDDDEVLEAGGTIGVQLVEETPTPFSTYTVVNSSANRSTVWVRDVNLLPKLSINSLIHPIPESDGAVDFVVTTELDEAETITVRYIASEVGDGNFLNENDTPSQEVANSQSLNFEQIGDTNFYSANLRVPIHDDNVGERRGTILVHLLADNAPTESYIIASDDTAVASAKILDDDAPELTIRPGGTVTEGVGQTANFIIVSEVLPKSALTLRYRPLSISFLAAGVSGSEVTASSPITFGGDGPYVSTLRVPIDNDDVIEATNLLTVMLLEEEAPASSYTVAFAPYNLSFATVVDDDLLPLIEITAPSEPINENTGEVRFKLSTLINPVDTLTIRYDPSEVAFGDFLNENANPNQEAVNTQDLDFEFDIVTSRYVSHLEVPIHNDQVGERAGEIQVTLLSDDNDRWTYRVASDGSQSVNATILDDDVPILSISDGEAVTEGVGRTANFTITSSFMPASPLTINYQPESTNFLAIGESGNPTSTETPLTFSTTSPYITVLSVAIDNDEIAEAHGSITVTLLDESTIGSTYIVVESPQNRAEVSVTDDDTLPLLTLSSPIDPTPESNGFVDFIVVTTTDLGINTSLSVRYQASEVALGNFLNETSSPSQEETNTSPLSFEYDSQTSNFIATLSVPIHDDDVGEATGSISVSLLSDRMLSETYSIASDGSETATATIWDDDAPELSIADGPTVTEGPNRMAKFPVTALVSPNKSMTLSIRVSKLDQGNGNFLATTGSTTATVDFSNQATSGILSIPISSDDVIEDNGIIRVVLIADNASPITYLVADEPNNSAEVIVVDDDSLPLLQITSPTEPTPESDGEVVFNISTSQNFETSLVIRFQPMEVQSGDFLNENASPSQEEISTKSINFSYDQKKDGYIATLRVPIHDDDVGENTGEISVELLADNKPAETYRIDTADSNTVTAKIWDDDAPELRISAGATVIEDTDQNAIFTITANISPNRAITLYYSTSQPETGSGNFLANEGPASQSLDFTNEKTSDTLMISLARDDIAELDGTITVTLTPDQADPITYTLTNSPQNSASVRVIDDDSIPILSILPPSNPTPESNGNVTFSVIADRDPRTNFTVWYTPSEIAPHDFLDADASPNQEIKTSQQLNFTPLGDNTRSKANLTIPIHDDEQGESTGSIRITLQVDQNSIELYRINSDGTETAIAIIWDDEAPELLIADGPAVVEKAGRFARFPISTPISPNRLVTVYFNLSQRGTGNGNFLTREGDLFDTLDFTSGKLAATLSIPIAADEMLEDNGDIKVTLTSDQANPKTYTVTGEPDNHAFVTVIDYLSLPILSISPPSAGVAENEGIANFKLTTEHLPNDSITVRYQAAEVDSGDFLNENSSPSQEAIATQLVNFSQSGGSGPYFGTLSVPIHNDSVGENTGSIAVTLFADDNTAETYFVTADSLSSAKATIWDDDAPELLIEGLNAVTEDLGQTADFKVNARVSPNKFLNLHYSVSEPSSGTGNFVETVGPDQAMLDFRNLRKSDILSIPIVSDLNIEDDGLIKVTLVSDFADPMTYTVIDSSANIAEVIVVDDDSLPYISITAPSDPILENEGVVSFTITSPANLGNNASIYYLPSEVLTGDFLNDNAIPSQESKSSQGLNLSQVNGNGLYQATLTIPIHDDNVGENTGKIAVTLIADEAHAKNYRIRQDGTETAEVTILDDDAPELSIQAGAAVTEGPQVTANFTLIARSQPRTPLFIRYQPVSENFLATGISENIQETETSLTFNQDETSNLITTTLSVEIDNDNVSEVNGDLAVTLIADDKSPLTYTLASEDDISATIQVFDDDAPIPTISIVGPATPQRESAGYVEFELIANTDPGRRLAISYTPENINASEFLATPSGEPIMTDLELEFSDNGRGIFTSILRVAIDDDQVPESTGAIALTLNDDPMTPITYVVASGSDASATAMIWDNDAPELVIAGRDPISESISSGQAKFTVSTNVRPLDPILVNFIPESSDFINNSGQPDSQLLVFDDENADNIYTADLVINIVQDSVPELNGEIIVTLEPDSQPETTYTMGKTKVATIQISDDDAAIPELTISGPVTPLQENVGQVSFRIFASEDPRRPIELRYTLSETGSDFLNDEIEKTVMIPNLIFVDDEDGQFFAEINIPIVNDEDSEPDGAVEVVLEPDLNVGILQTYTLGSQMSHLVNIWDDELPELTISAGEDVFEGPSASANFIVNATLQPESNIRIRYIATSENYLSPDLSGNTQESAILNFVESGIGSTYTSVLNIAIEEDDVQEADGQIEIELVADNSYPPRYTLGNDLTAVVNVFDNDTPRFNIANSEIVEGDSGQSSMEFIVTIQPPVQQIQRIKWLTTSELGDSAVVNQDFVAGNGELIFAAGETEQRIRIPIIGDTTMEPRESFSVVLFEPSTNEVVLGNVHARGIIINDDFELAVENSQIVEGNSGRNTGMPFTISITPAPDREVELEWEARSLDTDTTVEDEDFNAEVGQITFAQNQTEGIIEIVIIGDNVAELDETFTIELNLQAGAGKVINKVAKGTIENDDSGISIADATVVEGNSGQSEIRFIFTLAPVSNQLVSVDWSTALRNSNTATIDSDFEATRGTLRFAAGESLKFIRVKVFGDEIAELAETFSIELSNPTAGIELLNTVATGTIQNDDYGLRISNATSVEGQSGEITDMVFDVVLDPPLERETLRIDWRTESIFDENAAEDSDYLTANGTLFFNPNESQQSITVEIYDDIWVEQNEQFVINLSNPVTLTPSEVQIGLINATGFGTIVDNDVAELSVENFPIREMENQTVEMNFTVRLNPSYDQDFVINWQASTTADDSARERFDFRAETGELLFAAGETEKTFSIQILDDEEVEPDETFTVSFFSEQIDGIAFIEPNIKGTIRDNDTFVGLQVISIVANSEFITEGETAEFTISSFPEIPENKPLMVDIIVSQVGDYLMWRSPKTILLDGLKTTLSFETQDDEIEEEDGSILVTIVDSDDNYIISQGGERATITVKSDDIGESQNSEPNISIASTAVNSILAQLQSGFPIKSSLTETNQDLPIISITAKSTIIDEGELAEYIIKSEGGSESTVINFEVQVSEVGKSINWPVATSVQISSNSSILYRVETYNDEIAEESGEIIVKIPKNESYLIAENAGSAVVTVSDEMDRIHRSHDLLTRSHVVLNEAMKSVAETTSNGVMQRIEHGFHDNQVVSFEIGGQGSIPELLKKSGYLVNDNTADLHSIFDDSSFSMTLLSNDFSNYHITLWGNGDQHNFDLSARELGENWLGSAFTGQIGLDTLVGDELLAGLSTSVTEGELKLENSNSDDWSILATTSSLSPYFGWLSENQRTDFQVLANFGSGRIKIEQKPYKPEFVNSSLNLVATRGHQLLSTTENFLGGTNSLSIMSDAWLMHQLLESKSGLFSQISKWSHHFDLKSEFSQRYEFEQGTDLSPKLSIGLHLDQKGNHSMMGLELGSEIVFNHPIGLNLSGNGQLIFDNEGNNDHQLVSGQFKYDKFNDDLGLDLAVQSKWGTIDQDERSIIDIKSELKNSIFLNQPNNTTQIISEIGYGLNILDQRGILNPFSRFELVDEKQINYSVGSEFSISSNARFEFETKFDIQTSSLSFDEVQLKGSISW